MVLVTPIASTFRNREYPIQTEIASNTIIIDEQQQEKKSDNIDIRFKQNREDVRQGKIEGQDSGQGWSFQFQFQFK